MVIRQGLIAPPGTPISPVTSPIEGMSQALVSMNTNPAASPIPQTLETFSPQKRSVNDVLDVERLVKRPNWEQITVVESDTESFDCFE